MNMTSTYKRRIMKRFYIVLVIILLVAFSSCNGKKREATNTSISNQEIKKVANDFFIALGTSDTTLLTNLVSDDFYMFEHEQRWTLDSLLSLMPMTIGRVWELKDIDINKNKELVHISYFNNSINPVGRSWYESMLIKKTDSGLKIRFMHSTKLYLK